MALVDDLRGLIAAGTAEYTDGAGTAYWSDAQLTSYLNHRRQYVFEEPINYFAATGQYGTVLYQTGKLDIAGRFDAGTTNQYGTIIDSSGSVVTDWTLSSDGWVAFTSDQRGSARYLTSWTYDLFAAAADVLEAWASNVKLHFDAETDQQRFDRSQKYKMLLEQAAQYRKKQIIEAVPIVRSDEC